MHGGTEIPAWTSLCKFERVPTNSPVPFFFSFLFMSFLFGRNLRLD